MGPSGAGKSSLLTYLLGRTASYGTPSGELLFNGEVATLAQYKAAHGFTVGFVPQDDVLLGELTVQECLEYTAYWRLPAAMTALEKRDVVRYVLRLLDLEEIRDELVGDAIKRGISGGQRKRVSIGMELVADPTILFLDEPTSGLDSSTSALVMARLREIAALGTTVVVVLHQPRYEIFCKFHDVMLLGKGGKTVYTGPTSEVLPYFQGLGYVLPPNVNPADFFMDAIAGDVKPVPRPAGSAEAGPDPASLTLFESWQRVEAQRNTDEQHAVMAERALRPAPPVDVAPRTTVGGVYQAYLFAVRSFVQMRRNVVTELSDLLLIIVTAFVVGFCFRAPLVQDIPRVNLMMVLSVTVLGLQQSLRMFGNEKLMFFRDCAGGVNRSAYYVGKCVAALFHFFALPFVFLAVFYGFNGPRADFGSYYAYLLLGHWNGQAVGQLISLLLSPNKAQLAGVALSLLFTFVSGFLPTLPELDAMGGLATFAYTLSFTRYQMQALFLLEVRQLTPVFAPQVQYWLEQLGYVSGPTEGTCLGIMFGIGCAFRVLCYVVLVFKDRDKQL